MAKIIKLFLFLLTFMSCVNNHVAQHTLPKSLSAESFLTDTTMRDSLTLFLYQANHYDKHDNISVEFIKNWSDTLLVLSASQSYHVSTERMNCIGYTEIMGKSIIILTNMDTIPYVDKNYLDREKALSSIGRNIVEKGAICFLHDARLYKQYIIHDSRLELIANEYIPQVPFEN